MQFPKTAFMAALLAAVILMAAPAQAAEKLSEFKYGRIWSCEPLDPQLAHEFLTSMTDDLKQVLETNNTKRAFWDLHSRHKNFRNKCFYRGRAYARKLTDKDTLVALIGNGEVIKGKCLSHVTPSREARILA